MRPASGAGGAEAGVVGEHGGADRDVRATVEEVVRLAAEASGPVERDGHVTDGGPAAHGLDGVDEPESVGGSSGASTGRAMVISAAPPVYERNGDATLTRTSAAASCVPLAIRRPLRRLDGVDVREIAGDAAPGPAFVAAAPDFALRRA